MPNEYSHTPVTVEGMSAVVIGGTSGIGRTIATGFAAEGADVIATSRDTERVESTATALRNRGATTTEVTCNVRDRESLVSLREIADELFDGVDIVVYSVGAIAGESVTSIDEDEWEMVLDVGLSGAYRVCQVFEEGMEDGSIIVVSSISSGLARPNRVANCSTKAGLGGLVRSAAVDLGPDVRVNAIEPGFIDTGLLRNAPGNEGLLSTIESSTPADRVGDPEDVVGAAIFLASRASNYTTGTVVTVDGGYSVTSE